MFVMQGTMLNPQDLQRVSAEKAAAVLVLCNKFSSDPSKNFQTSSYGVRFVANYRVQKH